MLITSHAAGGKAILYHSSPSSTMKGVALLGPSLQMECYIDLHHNVQIVLRVNTNNIRAPILAGVATDIVVTTKNFSHFTTTASPGAKRYTTINCSWNYRISMMHPTYLCVCDSEQADCSVSLGCIQWVVADGYKCHFFGVEVFVKNLP